MPISNKTKKYNIQIRPLHLSYSEQRRLYFPAIITNLKNNFETKWEEENVYGKMDPIGSFSGTSRKISLSFRIVSTSDDECIDNLNSLSSLINMIYPTFVGKGDKDSNTSILQKPPFFELKFMNILGGEKVQSGLRGYFLSFDVDTPFGTEDTSIYIDDSKLFFTDATVTLDFRVLHQSPVGWYESNKDGGDMSPGYPFGASIDSPTFQEILHLNQTEVESLQSQSQEPFLESSLVNVLSANNIGGR